MHSLVTLQEALIGLAIAIIAAVLIAIGMDISKLFKNSIFPHLIVTQTVPVMVLGPLFTIWLGFGAAPKILMVILMCFFPMVISLSDALSSVDQARNQLIKKLRSNSLADLHLCENSCRSSQLIFRHESRSHLLHFRSNRWRMAKLLSRIRLLYAQSEERLYA